MFRVLLLIMVVGELSSADEVRQRGTAQHSIETRVVVDKWAVQKWTVMMNSLLTSSAALKQQKIKDAITSYVKAVFVGVNDIFKQLQSKGIDIDVRIINILFIEEDMMAPSTQNATVDMHRALSTLYFWLRKKRYPLPDHTLLLTGLDLTYENDRGVVGVSHKGKMCGVWSLSVVEAHPNGKTAPVLAHELSHSVGASHDGHLNNCSSGSLMIMDATRNRLSPLNFHISSCTVDSVLRFLARLDSLGTNCLSPAKTTTAEVTGKPLGQLYGPDTICKMTVGPQSFFARILYGPGGNYSYSAACYILLCHHTDAAYTPVEGTDGYPCGSGKECRLGACVKSDSGDTAVSETCPFGDHPKSPPVYRGESCGQVVARYTGVCDTSPTLARSCCHTCHSPECSGDVIPGCAAVVPLVQSLCADPRSFIGRNCCRSCAVLAAAGGKVKAGDGKSSGRSSSTHTNGHSSETGKDKGGKSGGVSHDGKFTAKLKSPGEVREHVNWNTRSKATSSVVSRTGGNHDGRTSDDVKSQPDCRDRAKSCTYLRGKGHLCNGFYLTECCYSCSL